jgi:hypothetical protein
LRRICFGVLLTATLSFPALAAEPLPRLPFVDRGVIIGECGLYGPWWASAKTAVYVRERDMKKVAFSLQPRELVTALTGNVYTVRLGWMRVTEPQSPEPGLEGMRQGERVPLLHSVGEGSYLAWRNGHTFMVSLLPGYGIGEVIKEPVNEWWVKIRDRRGRTGWVWLQNSPPFYGVNGCGEEPGWVQQERKRLGLPQK